MDVKRGINPLLLFFIYHCHFIMLLGPERKCCSVHVKACFERR